MKRVKRETLLLAVIFCCFCLSLSLNSSTTSITSSSSCLPHQSSALLQLKQEFAFSHSKKFEDWNHTRDCCSWDGVTCDGKNGQVVGLDLSSGGIHGPLSPNSSLFDLLHLQSLNLAFNNFSFSTVPSRFGMLSRLSYLNLSYSAFSGQVPTEISQLTELVLLDLSSYENIFDDFPSLEVDLTRLVQNMTNLRVLHLDHVGSLSSLMPESLVNLSSLTSLSLAGCDLQGEFPNYIFNLPKIQSINMSRNSLSGGFLPEFQSGSLLKLLDLSLNFDLSGKLPDSIGSLKSLTVLNLRSCNFSGPFPSSIGNLSQLDCLDLSGNLLDGPLPSTLGNLGKLRVLYLSENEFKGDIPHSISKLTKLEEFDLSLNSFNTHINLSLLTNLVKLRKLQLRYGNFIGQIPSSLGNLTRLEELDLSGNNFSGQIPPSLGRLTLLKQLILPQNSFNSEIPSSLGNLTKLERLDLSSNSFRGQIPPSLGNLTLLKQLLLFENSFTREIPSSLGNLIHLELLDLSKNNFRGQIPMMLGNLRKLIILRLSYNAFTGKFPISLVNLTQLDSLYLSNNQLTELSDPSSALESFSSLALLSLSNNSIAGTIPSSLFRIPSLKQLFLDNNLLTSLDNRNISSSLLQLLDLRSNNLSIGLSIFSDMGNLNSLDLSYNNISVPNEDVNSTFPKFHTLLLSSSCIRQFPNFLKFQDELEILDLSDNKIEGKIPNWFWTMGQTTMYLLYLSNNSLSGWEEAHRSIIPWEGLEILDLHSNNLTGAVDPILCRIKLRVLDLSKNHLNGTIPPCLGNFSDDLVVLNLQENNFHGNLSNDMFTEYGSQILKVLDLSHNHLQGKVPESLIKCQELEVLNLGYNQISDTFPFWLQNLPKLKVLVLRLNKFEGPIWSPEKLPGFVELQIMDFSFNHFSGILPSEYFKNWTSMTKVLDDPKHRYVGGYPMGPDGEILYYKPVTLTNKGNELEYPKILTILVSIDLSNNQFHGEIPSTIGNLHSLVVLNLSSNNFRGLIPSSLGELTALESLDLSKNKLSGRIPQQLTKLTFLQYLNLSQNQLTGPIPQERQFSTFLNSSFDGNLGLCGPPLSKKCGDDATPTSSRGHRSESDNFGFSWRPVAMGYGCGVLIGVITGYVVISRRPYWLARTFGGFILR